MATLFVCAGDLSGERHAAALVRAMRARRASHAGRSGDRFLGLGGEAMRAAGVEIIVDRRALATGGFVELIPELGRILRAWIRLVRALRESDPDVVVLVDSGGFNLPFARRVRRTTRAKILYFIAPQVWAWRPGRLRKLAARADRIVVALPFERDFYARAGVEVDYYGHPLLDAPASTRVEASCAERSAARARLGLPIEGPILGLFPGSRRSEIVRHLPLMLASHARLRASVPALAQLVAVVVLAEGFSKADVARLVPDFRARDPQAVRFIENGSGPVFAAIDVALTKPGTVTLEAALAGVPMVVVGRAHPISAWLARRSLRVRSLALPNLLAQAPFVPELLQTEATPDGAASRLAPLFAGPERARQLAGLARIADRLGPPGSIDATAGVVEELLGSART